MPFCEFVKSDGYECEVATKQGRFCDEHKCKDERCFSAKDMNPLCENLCVSHYRFLMENRAKQAKEDEKNNIQNEKIRKQQDKIRKQQEKESERIKKENERIRKQQEKESERIKKENEKEAKRLSELEKHPYTFDELKQQFEERHFMCKGQLYRIEDYGVFTVFTETSAKSEYENWKYIEKDSEGNITSDKPISFYTQWKANPDRKSYNNIDFIPDVKSCPDNVYNLFEGFEVEKLEKKYEMTGDEINKQVELLINHSNFITGGYGDILIQQMARIIQRPWEKTGKAVLIRDMDRLFSFGGGTGKNLFIDFFGNKILGKKYYHVVSDNSELYDSFNTEFQGKLLIFVEEASGKDNFGNNGVMKSKITKNEIRINGKSQNHYNVKDYSNWFFTTNERNPVPIAFSDRRWMVFDSSKEKKGDSNYFKNLVESMNDEKTAYAFYKYLMNTYAPKIEANTEIKTSAYIDIKKTNASVIYKWLSSYQTLEYIKEDRSSTDLYSFFSNWAKITREEKDEKIISQSKFSRALMEEGSIFTTKEKTKSYNGFSINRVKLVEELKKIDLLDENFNLEDFDKIPKEETKPKIAGDMFK
jgi:uncharacterized protein YozE (UPF0346 family)